VIVDFHTHIFPPAMIERREEICSRDATFRELYADRKAKLATDGDLLRAMDEAGVDVSVALGFAWTRAEDCDRHNDYLVEAAERSGGRIVPFCAFQPAAVPEALDGTLSRIAGRVRGFGELRPSNQGYSIVRSLEEKVLAEAAGSGLPLLFHVTEPAGHKYPGKDGLPLSEFAEFVARNPGVTAIGGHWGGGLPFYGLMPEVAAAMTNVYVDTAASRFLYAPAVYRTVIDLIGPGRILFGSDYPLISPRAALEEARSAGLAPAELDCILGGNAARLLGLA
jgi:predicted TIM-barrel fold metal-dependent hydrolase